MNVSTTVRAYVEKEPATMTTRLSFVPLTDAAPIIVAKELGYFRRHGLDVELSRETSWASTQNGS